MTEENKNIASEPEPDYEKAEMDLLRDALKRSYSERFKMMTTLMKIGFMMKRAKIVQKDIPSKTD